MRSLRRLVPAPLLSAYHLALAGLGALAYRFPSRKLVVIGVTGTNGKTSTTEFLNAMFEEAGYKTALSNSIRTKVAGDSRPSTGRSMPGRFFLQRFMRQAASAGCRVCIIEMTSQGAAQYRHRCIALNGLIFLNLAPEHIESHGSYQAYADAKFELARGLLRSRKRPRVVVANAEDKEGARYLALPVEKAVGFTLSDRKWGANERGGHFEFEGAEIAVGIPGAFSVKNALAAACMARSLGADIPAIARGAARVEKIPGRLQAIDGGQPFGVVIDYALTPDAFEALFETYADKKKVCVFGSAGGGRDVWKRPILGKLAEENCAYVVLTNDIAYDEPFEKILNDIAAGMKKRPAIIPDRRLAIRRAFELAEREGPHTLVLITGMGIDNEITDANGAKIPWNEEQIVRQELERPRAARI